MSCAPRQIPKTGFPASMARRMNRFSATSQGSSSSSLTLMGPPMAMRKSTSSNAGISADSKNRVQVTSYPAATSQGRMQPRPSKGTCWK